MITESEHHLERYLQSSCDRRGRTPTGFDLSA